MKKRSMRVAAILVMIIALLGLTACSDNGGGETTIEITGLELSEGTISPSFDPATFDYTASVAYTVDEITVTVTTENEDLSVTINGTEVLPGTGEATITLSDGDNEIEVVVSEGTDSVTYTVVVTKELPPEISIVGPTSDSSGDVAISSGDTIDFGTITPADGYLEFTFEIENTGGSTLTLTAAAPDFVVISGTDADDFTVPTQPSEATIPPTGTAEFVIRFTNPGGGAEKTDSATATIESNDEDESVFTLSLTGYVTSV